MNDVGDRIYLEAVKALGKAVKRVADLEHELANMIMVMRTRPKEPSSEWFDGLTARMQRLFEDAP